LRLDKLESIEPKLAAFEAQIGKRKSAAAA
jgi:hypothetical protein